MKLEQQVTSLEISKRLKELGVKQTSLFVWQRQKDYQRKILTNNWKVILCNKNDNTGFGAEHGYSRYISAFTVAELGEILNQKYWAVRYRFYNKKFVVDATPIPHGIGAAVMPHTLTEKADTEADARGKMLIYLLENKLISDKDEK